VLGLPEDDTVSSSQVWFDGDRPTAVSERIFVQTLRSAAAGWNFADLTPGDTSTERHEIGRLVEIRVPLLTTARRILRACYDVDPAGGTSLQSEWTAFAYPFEGPDFEAPDPETDLW
jgi:hypothetical protein